MILLNIYKELVNYIKNLILWISSKIIMLITIDLAFNNLKVIQGFYYSIYQSLYEILYNIKKYYIIHRWMKSKDMNYHDMKWFNELDKSWWKS